MRAGSRSSSRNTSLVLLAGDIQRYRARTSSDQDVSSLELPAFDDNRVSTGETGNPVKSVDAVFGEISFPIVGNSIREAAFKHHQVAPINTRLARDAMPAHTRLRVDLLRTADQYPSSHRCREGRKSRRKDGDRPMLQTTLRHALASLPPARQCQSR